jgi:ABC-type amino acid transport system permease subunit
MRVHYRPRGSNIGVSGSPLTMYSLWWAWFMITLALTVAGLLIAMLFGSCWLVGRLARPRWPRASATICTSSARAAHAALHAIDVMNGHAA